MRKANVNDLFNITRLVTELGVKEQLFNAQKGKEDIEKIGFDFFYIVFENATSKESQKKIYDILSGPFEMNADEIGTMDIDSLISSFRECFNISTIVNFIKRAQSTMN